jgi:hypothetical protein
MDVSGACATDIPPKRLRAAAAASFIGARVRPPRSGSWRSRVRRDRQTPTTDQEVPLDVIEPDHGTADRGRQRYPSPHPTRRRNRRQRRSSTSADDPPESAPGPSNGAYAPAIVVLLTDGASNAGPEPVEAVGQAADRGVRVYTIGFGTADPAASMRAAVHRSRALRQSEREGWRRWWWRLPSRDRRSEAQWLTRPAAPTSRRAPTSSTVFQNLPTNPPAPRGDGDQRRFRRWGRPGRARDPARSSPGARCRSGSQAAGGPTGSPCRLTDTLTTETSLPVRRPAPTAALTQATSRRSRARTVTLSQTSGSRASDQT